MKIINKSFVIGMSSAFDVFPNTKIGNLPFNVSIGNGLASDKVALCNDMNKIGNDFRVAISKITENK